MSILFPNNAAIWTAQMQQSFVNNKMRAQANCEQMKFNSDMAAANVVANRIRKEFTDQLAQIQAQADSIFATEGAKAQALAATNKQLVDQANALGGQLQEISQKCKQLYEAYEQKEKSIENLRASGLKLITDLQKNEVDAKEIKAQIIQLRDTTTGLTAEIDQLAWQIIISRMQEEELQQACDQLMGEIVIVKTIMNNEVEREKKITELSAENALLSEMASKIMTILNNSETN